ncbi:tail fiber protein [Dryocola sp. BD626]|uniref:tail fiber protein n=1 Tax=Dryocola sp. BD626 TaxID=3133273 RepID=UPI003F50B55D
MSTKYLTLITTLGAARFAAATAGGTKINITKMAVGDGGGTLPTPDVNQNGLINETYRAALNKISVDEKNNNYVVAELVIPPEVGGFWMRELGLYDDTGVMVAVGNMAESYKPLLEEGSGRAQTLRMVIIISAIDSVELTIDTTTVMATQEYVDEKIAEHEQSRRHPDATLNEKGFAQLSSATDSSSEALAATPKAVKAAYDLANGKYTAQDSTTARKGIVQLSSATDSTSETLAATPKAVKTAYDLANGKYIAQDATTGRKGIVQLSSSTDSASETLAATPKAVKAANDNANGRVPAGRKINGKALSADVNLSAADVAALALAGGTMTGQISVADTGRGSWVNQNTAGAPIFQNINTTATSEYWPLFKQHYAQANSTWSGGTLVNEGGFYIHYLNSAGGTTNFNFKKDGQFIPGSYANFDAKYQAKGNYTPTGTAYTKAESDGRYQPKGNYTPTGTAYTKAESDGRYQAKGSYTPAGEAYTKAQSDARYVSTAQRGSQAIVNAGHTTLTNWEAPTGCYMTGINLRADLGDARTMGFYYRSLMIKTVSGGWVQIGN